MYSAPFHVSLIFFDMLVIFLNTNRVYLKVHPVVKLSTNRSGSGFRPVGEACADHGDDVRVVRAYDDGIRMAVEDQKVSDRNRRYSVPVAPDRIVAGHFRIFR